MAPAEGGPPPRPPPRRPAHQAASSGDISEASKAASRQTGHIGVNDDASTCCTKTRPVSGFFSQTDIACGLKDRPQQEQIRNMATFSRRVLEYVEKKIFHAKSDGISQLLKPALNLRSTGAAPVAISSGRSGSDVACMYMRIN